MSKQIVVRWWSNRPTITLITDLRIAKQTMPSTQPSPAHLHSALGLFRQLRKDGQRRVEVGRRTPRTAVDDSDVDTAVSAAPVCPLDADLLTAQRIGVGVAARAGGVKDDVADRDDIVGRGRRLSARAQTRRIVCQIAREGRCIGGERQIRGPAVVG